MGDNIIIESVETGESFSKNETTVEAFILGKEAASGGAQGCYNLPSSIFNTMQEMNMIQETDLELVDRKGTPMDSYTLRDGYMFDISQKIRRLIGYKDEKVGLLLIEGSNTKIQINKRRCQEAKKISGTDLDLEWFVKLYDANPRPSKIIYTLDKNLKTLNMDIEILYKTEDVEYINEPADDSYISNRLGEDINLDKLKNDSVPYQRIFFGAPGTGKSYKLNEEAKDYFGYDKANNLFYNNVSRVTFHSSYSYALFVGVYKPFPIANDITYKYVPGPLIKLLLEALKNPDKPYLLIIEEINRADVSYVFGDIFQLLDRDQDGTSTYSIDINQDLKLYITEFLSRIDDEEAKARIRSTFSNDITKLKLPPNLYIWSTMNSADQGVNPLDTAFKRRWYFEPLDIDNGEDLIQKYRMKLGKTDGSFSWNDYRKSINDELIKLDINEDKLLGAFFISKNELEMAKDDYNVFNKLFKNKVLMYLFEDVAKHHRKALFNVEKMTYANLCEQYDKKGIKIFTYYDDMELKMNSNYKEQ